LTRTAVAIAIAAIAAGTYYAVTPKRLFEAEQIPSLDGQVAIVTGANVGIGKESAYQLALHGARVVMACRSAKRANAAIEELRARPGGDGLALEFLALDLSSLASVKAFVAKFRSSYDRLDVLLNNAGVMAMPFRLSADGHEMQFAVNHLGHFLLTTELLDMLEASAPSRIVHVSSLAHKFPYWDGVKLDALNDNSSYNPWQAYGQSKLCNLLFSNALARRLAGSGVRSNAVHPGYVATDLGRYLSDSMGSFVEIAKSYADRLLALNPHDGALTSLYAATSPDIETDDIRGRYFVPIGLEASPSTFALDVDLQEKLWAVSDRLVAPFRASSPAA